LWLMPKRHKARLWLKLTLDTHIQTQKTCYYTTTLAHDEASCDDWMKAAVAICPTFSGNKPYCGPDRPFPPRAPHGTVGCKVYGSLYRPVPKASCFSCSTSPWPVSQ